MTTVEEIFAYAGVEHGGAVPWARIRRRLGPASKSSLRQSISIPRWGSKPREGAWQAVHGTDQTQNVTASDVDRGQLRVPRSAKRLLPAAKSRVPCASAISSAKRPGIRESKAIGSGPEYSDLPVGCSASTSLWAGRDVSSQRTTASRSLRYIAFAFLKRRECLALTVYSKKESELASALFSSALGRLDLEVATADGRSRVVTRYPPRMYTFPEGVSASWADRGLSAEPVPYADTHIRNYVVDHLRLPIEVPRPEGDWTLTAKVVGIWKSVVESLQVDDESWAIEPDLYDSDGFISHFYFEEMDPSSTMYDEDGHKDERAFALRIASWYDAARGELMNQLRLMRSRVAGPEDFPKHFPDASCKNIADLRARSKRKTGGSPISVLRFGLDQAGLEELVHLAAAEFSEELHAARSELVFRGYVDCMTTIGFTNGKPTQILCVEWAAHLTHVYPVERADPSGVSTVIGNARTWVRDSP